MNWNFPRGSDAIFEGTVLFATVQGATATNYSLAGGTLYFMAGSTVGTYGYTRNSASGTQFSFTATTAGVFQFAMPNDDTEGWGPGAYIFDVWLKTVGAKEYRIMQGTINLFPTMGTI